MNVILQYIQSIDNSVYHCVNQQWTHSLADRLFMLISNKNAMFLPIAAVILWVWLRGTVRERVAIVLGIVALILGDLFGALIKEFFQRPRPYLNPDLLDTARSLGGISSNSPSFPSNHAINTWALATCLIVYYRQQFRWIAWLFAAFAAAVCYSRIYVGVHYLSDVLAGTLIGTATAAALCFVNHHQPLCTRNETTNRLRWGYTTAAVLIVAVITGIRLSFIADINIDLSFEETQYWDWSRRLDWGYFSKPPMVAWIIHFFTQTVGFNNAFCVRLPAVLISLILVVAMWKFMRNIGLDEHTRFAAIVLACSMPLFAVGSVLMTTDTPLLLGWTLSLIFLWHALYPKPGANPLAHWVLTGVALGFALLSKYSAFYFHACLLIMLCATPALRHQLRRPGVWVAIAVSLVMLAPPLYWNFAHDWISFKHIAADATDQGQIGIKPLHFFEFLGSQIGICGPVTFIAAFLVAWRNRKSQTPLQQYLLWFVIPIFAVFTAKSLTSKVQANWIAMIYPALLLYATVTWEQALTAATTPAHRRKLATIAVAAIATTAPAALIAYYPLSVWETAGEKLMITQNEIASGTAKPKTYAIGKAIQTAAKPMLGWKQAAQIATEIRRQMPRPTQTIIITTSYQWAAEMAFYIEGQPQTYVVEASRHSQYDIWGGIEKHIGKDAIIITERSLPALQTSTLTAFENITAHGPYVIDFKGYPVRTIYIYKATTLKHPPTQQEQTF